MTIYYYILLYITIYYYILLYITIYYYILLYITIYYYILLLSLISTVFIARSDSEVAVNHYFDGTPADHMDSPVSGIHWCLSQLWSYQEAD